VREKYFAEVHALDAFGAQRWTNWGRGRSLTGADDEFDNDVFCGCFARHDCSGECVDWDINSVVMEI